MLSGRPLDKLRIKLACQRSISRANHPELLPNRSLLGPNGSSIVPFVLQSWETEL